VDLTSAAAFDQRVAGAGSPPRGHPTVHVPRPRRRRSGILLRAIARRGRSRRHPPRVPRGPRPRRTTPSTADHAADRQWL